MKTVFPLVAAIIGTAALVGDALGATDAIPENAVCIENASDETLFFTAEAGEDERVAEELAPGETLCTASLAKPVEGVVGVFADPDALEGCSRLATSGTTETMRRYVEFDRCLWGAVAPSATPSN